MGVQVMIEVPEKLYDQVEEIAQSTQRAVSEVLQEIVIRSSTTLFYIGRTSRCHRNSTLTYDK